MQLKCFCLSLPLHCYLWPSSWIAHLMIDDTSCGCAYTGKQCPETVNCNAIGNPLSTWPFLQTFHKIPSNITIFYYLASVEGVERGSVNVCDPRGWHVFALNGNHCPFKLSWPVLRKTKNLIYTCFVFSDTYIARMEGAYMPRSNMFYR